MDLLQFEHGVITLCVVKGVKVMWVEKKRGGRGKNTRWRRTKSNKEKRKHTDYTLYLGMNWILLLVSYRSKVIHCWDFGTT